MGKISKTLEDIKAMSYTDFVGYVNQWNVGPGAYVTLNKWIQFANISSHSNLLEIACTTGFSSREIVLETGCQAVGIDISAPSIERAISNSKELGLSKRLKYFVEDGYKFNSSEKFSHIITGAALGFFNDPKAMINKCVSLLKDGGLILSCEFYIVKKIPNDLIKNAKKVFNIDITQVGYKQVMSKYMGLELIYEDKNAIEPETESELEHYCTSTINRVCAEKKITDKRIISLMYDRLMEIKLMSNELRPFQNYNVLVHRYRKRTYPNRFVELF